MNPGFISVTAGTFPLTIVQDQPTNFQLTASGGCPPYTWTVANPNGLPPGISISASGLVSGTLPLNSVPCADTGFYDNGITVTDNFGDSGRSTVSFYIDCPVGTKCNPFAGQCQ
ncbi:MAG TPA: putative Ig domain-containing protein [Terriglobales bacterium]|nr:putative Ig domain-containing protein [Terriglobales bacterium]